MKMEQSVQERIRERAYQLWDTSGRMNGEAEQHWLAAEREILAERLAPPHRCDACISSPQAQAIEGSVKRSG
jgi:hypothetical protein